MGGAVITAITAAIVSGFKVRTSAYASVASLPQSNIARTNTNSSLLQGEPKVCDLCQGVGGAKCFACSGSGLSTVRLLMDPSYNLARCRSR